MSENNRSTRDDSKKIGIISNYITEQLFSRDYDLVNIPYDNFNAFLETSSINLFILDNHIYEVDHPWFEKDYTDLMHILKHKEVLVVKNDTYPLLELFSTYKILDFNSSNIDQLNKTNVNQTPLLVNEILFNPAYAIKTHDIVFLNRSNNSHDGNIQDLITRKKLNIIDVNIKYLTRDALQELSKDIKKSKFIYIYNNIELDSLILKYIEIISYLQNTIVIFDEDSKINLTRMRRAKYIEFLYNNPLYLERITIKNNRNAFLNNSLINTNSTKKFLNEKSNDQKIKISVITSTIRRKYIDNYIKQLNSQNGVKLEVILLTHKFEFSDLEVEELKKKANFNLIILKGDKSESLGECLNKCLRYVSNDYVTKMDDDDYYTANYLLDSYIALKFSEASIVGKGSHFVYLQGQNLYVNRLYNNKNKYVSRVIGGSIFSKTSLLKEYNFDDVSSGEDTKLFRRVLKDGHLIYANHPYETCLFRSSDRFNHTWQVDDEYIMSGSKVVSFGDPSSFLYIE